MRLTNFSFATGVILITRGNVKFAMCKFIPVSRQFSLVTHREVEDLTTGKGNCIALKKAYQFKITEDNQRRNFRQIFPYFKLRLNEQSFDGTHKLFQYFKIKFGSKPLFLCVHLHITLFPSVLRCLLNKSLMFSAPRLH